MEKIRAGFVKYTFIFHYTSVVLAKYFQKQNTLLVSDKRSRVKLNVTKYGCGTEMSITFYVYVGRKET